MMSFVVDIWTNFISFIKTIGISDIVDIIIVWYLVYKLIQLVRETRAEQLLKGIVILLIFYVVATQIISLKTVSYILNYVFQFGVVAVCVVFQPELRRALEQVGRSRIGSKLNIFMPQEDAAHDEGVAALIAEVTQAVAHLSSQRTGALIVFERQTKLGEVIASGTMIDSRVSSELLINLFVPNTPLHDGAVVIRDARVYAAGCILPLMENNDLSKELGTRHRAALGVSEVSDALVVVVSEETGIVSTAENGLLRRGFDSSKLSALLTEKLATTDSGEKKNLFRIFNRHDKEEQREEQETEE